MSHWESTGKSDEYYTPQYVFDAMDVRFDTDVAAPIDRTFCCAPCDSFITESSLSLQWNGFVWMNPPYGGRNKIRSWLNKLWVHNNGVALSPDRSSATWWQDAARYSSAMLAVHGKIKFRKPDGSYGGHPSNGSTLFAYGDLGVIALKNAQENGLGILLKKI